MMEETSEEEVPNPPPGTPTPLREIEEEEMDEETKKKNDFEKSLWTRFIQGFAIATVVLAVLAMIFSDSRAVTVVAGVIAIGVSGCVIYQQQLLQDTDTLRKVQNELRKEVNRLQEENNTLHAEVDKMEATVSKLKDSETKLDAICQEQGSNVSSLVSLVKENGEIQTQMIDITKAETLQSLYNAILQVDRDCNFKIGEFEARELLFRLQVDPRVQINEETLSTRLKAAGGEISIRDLSEDLMSAHHHKDGEHIFTFTPENFKN